ncbi:MAG: hypothetical protein E7015_03960 [Alphaproteobacteria bacterium]|nr:hypothetical protein [Alphaproteobacteria bacterium]
MKKSIIAGCVSISICMNYFTLEAKFDWFDFIFGVKARMPVSENSEIDTSKNQEKAENIFSTETEHHVSDSIPLEPINDLIISEESKDIEISKSDIQLSEKPHNEITINESVKIKSIDELLAIITNNISMLSDGRHLPRDERVLLQQKKEIETLQNELSNSNLKTVEKIEILEQILIAYNNICEIPVAFLSDIDHDMIERVLNTLFFTYAKEAQNLLTHIFNTDVSFDIKQIVQKAQTDADTDAVKHFILWMKTQLQRIPLDLQNTQQKKLIIDLMNNFDQTIAGDFKDKCFKLKTLVDLYNSIKAMPCRLTKVSSSDIQKLIAKMVEHQVFEKILSKLDTMSAANFSEDANLDEEAMAARNIKKTRNVILGATSVSGEKEFGTFEKFRSAITSQDIAEALNQAITQFNYTVEWYNKAMVRTKKANVSEIDQITDDVERIVNKLQSYNAPLEK